MSRAQVQSGEFLDLIAPAGGVVSGQGYVIGSIFVVAQISAAAGEVFSGAREGVHKLAMENTTAVYTQGEIAYWDDTAKQFDESASGRYAVGSATVASGATDATATVVLDEKAVVAVP